MNGFVVYADADFAWKAVDHSGSGPRAILAHHLRTNISDLKSGHARTYKSRHGCQRKVADAPDVS
ncbi:MAG TPA: hypothetical protein VMF66_13515 [Candidatus Acidoferrum sp.]|nr:hypothetical protein [Candidatus Acidoferrum sp.]